MSETLSPKQDFLAASFIHSVIWQSSKRGTNGSMLTVNDAEHDLHRLGVEKEEAQIEAAKVRLFSELDTLLSQEAREALWFELIDIYNFLISAAVKSGMSPDIFEETWEQKNKINDEKYQQKYFEGVPLAEGIENARNAAADRLEENRAESRRRNGHPRPDFNRKPQESEELDGLVYAPASHRFKSCNAVRAWSRKRSGEDDRVVNSCFVT